MLDQKTGVPKQGQRLLPGKAPSSSPRQRRLMFVALLLLLVSLVAVLYRDRDFWFPDTEEADSRQLSPPQTQDTPPPVTTPSSAAVQRKKEIRSRAVPRVDPQPGTDPPSEGPTITATRTVLPPLEVEVVAGDAHQAVHPGTNAVHVDLQRAPSGQVSAPVREDSGQTAARVATPAAQRTSVSTSGASEIVSRSVQPDYPMLARQMKVQGSVVMQALIGRDGLIEDLHVLSGPPILANAAEEAVRQWHFKPHFVGAQPVETRANITVNFTISTN
jgi:periplasmic protein TonB